jgi:hypothetical protein
LSFFFFLSSEDEESDELDDDLLLFFPMARAGSCGLLQPLTYLRTNGRNHDTAVQRVLFILRDASVTGSTGPAPASNPLERSLLSPGCQKMEGFLSD